MNTFSPNESTQIYTHSPTNRQTERKTKSNNPPNPQTNPNHLQMSPVRSSKIPPPRTRNSLNDRRRSGSLATRFWVTSVQRCMKGCRFSVQWLVLLHQFLAWFVFGFPFWEVRLAVKFRFIFWLVEEAERIGALSHVAMLPYQSGLVKVWAPRLFLHCVNDELIMYEWIALVFKREKVSEGVMQALNY